MPHMHYQFYPDRPQLPSGGGIVKMRRKKNTEYAKKHLNPDQSSGNVFRATNEWPDYPDQPRH